MAHRGTETPMMSQLMNEQMPCGSRQAAFDQPGYELLRVAVAQPSQVRNRVREAARYITGHAGDQAPPAAGHWRWPDAPGLGQKQVCPSRW